jgi:AAA+ ATPase superfamily predicted ATPase
MILPMKLPFLNRDDELRRLRGVLAAAGGELAVVYGRRRCGKSTLIQNVLGGADLYFLADQREAPLQIQALAQVVEKVFPGFSSAHYPTWDALLKAIRGHATHRINLILDEFPYLAHNAPELPSLLQGYLDSPGKKNINFVLCGSSQRMMQGLVLDRTAPLYGRAREILRIEPLRAGWIPDALGLHDDEAIEAYALWGGVPRYWELAQPHGGGLAAARELILDRKGVLHEEPPRLLLDELRTTGQAFSLLSLIGGGCHRLSEIAGRMGKPAGSLSRPLGNLIELGYVRREVPFGEKPKSSKRTLYTLNDPFLRFYFRFVQPNQSVLELGITDPVEALLRNDFAAHTAGVWEDLARCSVPFLNVGGLQWGPAARWWGQGTNGCAQEFDVVAESTDGGSVLVGEVKWQANASQGERHAADLRRRISTASFIRGRSVVPALWLRRSDTMQPTVETLLPSDVLRVLR